MVRIKKEILDAIAEKTGYSKRHVHRMIERVMEASGYTIPNRRIGANILASKLCIKINQILNAEELAQVSNYLSEPVIRSIQIRAKSDHSKSKRAIKISEKATAEDEIRHLVEQNKVLSRNLEQMKTKIQNLDPKYTLDKLKLPQLFRNRIDKAYSRIDQGSFSEAIINCYLVSETLVNNLFAFLYPNSKGNQIKHEDKIKKIWNDEEKEKHKYPGIRVITSLLAVILWYRNKMGAHTEMTPTKEAARICVISLIQALIEFERLGVKVD